MTEQPHDHAPDRPRWLSSPRNKLKLVAILGGLTSGQALLLNAVSRTQLLNEVTLARTVATAAASLAIWLLARATKPAPGLRLLALVLLGLVTVLGIVGPWLTASIGPVLALFGAAFSVLISVFVYRTIEAHRHELEHGIQPH
ncbi:hypothetical protein QEZ54_35730 [Catellatospora sp. KI3]|uniref:hypothetical protein n=1 Tax=Catellatospora sp. KI3 TaxID=3041620 RepID=UPI002482A984|nr:hypothetical protein [Catellatospora sp. KI3]MDI1466343.1 hypothetical protein [Catellatospora sp. KI3]